MGCSSRVLISPCLLSSLPAECEGRWVEMADNSIYSTLELPAAPRVQDDSRWKVKGSKGFMCSQCSRCPNLWMRNGSHCYYFSMEKRDWNSSLKFCADKGSHLLTFPDNQGVNLFQEYVGEDFYWIGLRDIDGWRWEDGPALSLSILSNSVVQKCGTIHRCGLHASSCEVALQWICEKVLP